VFGVISTLILKLKNYFVVSFRKSLPFILMTMLLCFVLPFQNIAAVLFACLLSDWATPMRSRLLGNRREMTLKSFFLQPYIDFTAIVPVKFMPDLNSSHNYVIGD